MRPNRRPSSWAYLAVFLCVAVLWIGANVLLWGEHEPEEFEWLVETPPIDIDSLVDQGGNPVTLTRAEVAIFSASLEACPHEHGRLAWLKGVFSTAVASAGHGDDAFETEFHGPVVVDLLEPGLVPVGESSSSEPSFCEGHVSFSGTDSAAKIAGDITPTVVLEGVVQTATGEQSFVLETATAWGTKVSLDDITIGDGMAMRVDPTALLAGIDVAALTTSEQPVSEEDLRVVLRSLAATVTLVSIG